MHTISVKTNKHGWSKNNVIVPFSIHSAFSQGDLGLLKVEAMMAFIKSHAQKKVTIVLCERAHLKTFSLNHAAPELALEAMHKDTHNLFNRIKPFLDECEIKWWHEFVSNHPEYMSYKNLLWAYYNNDKQLQEIILEEVKKSYTPERAKMYPDEQAYTASSIEDIIEQLTLLPIAAQKGYGAHLYPGKEKASAQYIRKKHPETTLVHCETIRMFLH